MNNQPPDHQGTERLKTQFGMADVGHHDCDLDGALFLQQ